MKPAAFHATLCLLSDALAEKNGNPKCYDFKDPKKPK
jgi:hypothetical protein